MLFRVSLPRNPYNSSLQVVLLQYLIFLGLEMEVESTKKKEGPIFRDIRRYYCEYCGICRSKKSLISSHILSHHQDEVNKRKADDNEKKEGLKFNTCDECGLSFQKPAHLKQHMLSHSLEGYKLLRVMEIY